MINELVFNSLTKKRDNKFFNKLGDLPNPDRIIRRKGNYSDLRELKNDPHVWACVQSRKSGTLAKEYSLVSNNISTNIEKFIADQLDRIDMDKLKSDILESRLFGFQVLEINWQKIDSKLEIEKIIPREQENFTFDSDDKLKLKDFGKSLDIPLYKVLNCRYEASDTNPYGTALLSKCYWSVKFKTSALKYWAVMTEKYGMPVLLGKYNRGTNREEAEKLANSLFDLVQDSVIVAPSDIDLQLFEPNRQSSTDLYFEMIKHCNTEISKVLLSQTLTTEVGAGSYAASQTHLEVRNDILLADSKAIETTISKLIQYVIELNFGKQTGTLKYKCKE